MLECRRRRCAAVLQVVGRSLPDQRHAACHTLQRCTLMQTCFFKAFSRLFRCENVPLDVPSASGRGSVACIRSADVTRRPIHRDSAIYYNNRLFLVLHAHSAVRQLKSVDASFPGIWLWHLRSRYCCLSIIGHSIRQFLITTAVDCTRLCTDTSEPSFDFI
jgi:hypothetical protein